MDKLSFSFDDNITLINPINNLKTYSITIHLNDELLSTNLNVADLLCLKEKFIVNTEFFLFTCSCGIPECAGYYEKTTHLVNDTNVIWNIPNENDIDLSKYQFIFNKEEFYIAVENLYLNILKLELENSFHSTLVDQNFTSEKDEDYIGIPLNMALNERTKHHINLNNFIIFLNNYAPELYQNSYCWIYNDHKEKISLKFFIFCLLNNNINSRTYIPYYVKKTMLAIKALKLCLNNDFSLFEKIAHHNYKKFDGNPILQAIRALDIEDAKFDLAKLHLIKV